MIASELNIPFLDADDFHPEANKQKMAKGEPLNDQDRLPWLQALQEKLASAERVVLACSALRDSYRMILDPDSKLTWIYLNGSKELIYKRMRARSNHFMKADMLDSQFTTLEVPENAIEISIDQSPEEMIHEILSRISTS